MRGLSDGKFKTTVTNRPRAVMEKVDNMQDQMSNVSREIQILRKNQKEMLEFKDPVREMKNVFHSLVSRLHTARERISELEDV